MTRRLLWQKESGRFIEAVYDDLQFAVNGQAAKLLRELEMHGVTAVESLGRTFDPAMYEAVGVMESSQFPPDTVAEELQGGYRWDDELLRPARVRVAR
jgi:molecular chaperone GrpE (heat shock protein)